MSAVHIAAATGVMWNGPTCPTCHAKYLGTHTCSTADILRRVQELLALLPGTPQVSCRPDPTRTCPCRPENGGSGVCGCVLGGPQITC